MTLDGKRIMPKEPMLRIVIRVPALSLAVPSAFKGTVRLKLFNGRVLLAMTQRLSSINTVICETETQRIGITDSERNDACVCVHSEFGDF